MNIKEEAEQLRIRADGLDAIIQSFPDAKTNIDRWKTKRTSSPSANPKCNMATFKHSCGCCGDAPLYAYPFYKMGDLEINSDPIIFVIGEKVCGGDIERVGWEKEMRDAKIPEDVIESTRRYLAAVRPNPDEEEDD